MSIPLKAEDIMTPEISYVDKEASIKDAAVKMLNEGIGCLVVTEQESPIGIISKRDIIRAVVFEKRDPDKGRVEDIMSTPIISVNSGDSIRQVIDIMIKNNISHVPVLEGNKIVGIISDYDITQALAEILDYVEALSIKGKTEE